MIYYSTRQVEKLLGVNNIAILIHRGKVEAPEKGPGGAFFWTVEDLERASWALLHRPYEPVEEERR